MSSPIEILEVGPRDGLQNEKTPINTADKLAYIQRIVESGIRRIEVTSFVRPDRVPQLADAEEVLAGLGRPTGVEISALVLNRRGVLRAVDTSVTRVNLIVVASDEFSVRNQGVNTKQGIGRFLELSTLAHENGLDVTLTIGASFGCPFEGEISENHVLDIIRNCLGSPADEICLADTIGVASPLQVGRLFAEVGRLTDRRLRAHFHNTRNTGYANAYAAMAAGVSVLDASTGGVGGCPFAPAATGNIATEDLLYALQRDGLCTYADTEPLIAASHRLGVLLGSQVPAQLGRTPKFPG